MKLCDTFKLDAAVDDVVEQFVDFQKYAVFQDKENGALDSFECWKQSILKVSGGREHRRAAHPVDGIQQLVTRLGAFRGRHELPVATVES